MSGSITIANVDAFLDDDRLLTDRRSEIYSMSAPNPTLFSKSEVITFNLRSREIQNRPIASAACVDTFYETADETDRGLISDAFDVVWIPLSVFMLQMSIQNQFSANTLGDLIAELDSVRKQIEDGLLPYYDLFEEYFVSQPEDIFAAMFEIHTRLEAQLSRRMPNYHERVAREYGYIRDNGLIYQPVNPRTLSWKTLNVLRQFSCV